MMTIDHIYGQEQIPGAAKLFVAVQRLEYALKRAGLRHGNRADASWKKLGTKLGRRFFDRIAASGPAKILIDSPPAKLSYELGELVWIEQIAPRDATELFDTIHGVRNSLFHGEKRADVPRDIALIAAALYVVEQAIVEAERLATDDPTLELFCRFARGHSSPLRRRRS